MTTHYPVVVLNDRPRQTQPAAGAVPELAAHSAELLVLRATAPAGTASDRLAQLHTATDGLPEPLPTAETATELHRCLPLCAQAVALPAPEPYGPWTERTSTAA